MTTRRLRRILLEAALSTLPLLGTTLPVATTSTIALGAGGCCGAGSEHHELLVSRGDDTLGPLVDRCEVNDLDCDALCAKALAIGGFSTPDEGTLTMCRITDEDLTTVRLETRLVIPEGCGRRPDGLHDAVAATASGAAAYLAACAHLEAASVHAFVRLARDLAAHGAPRRLVRAALAAADDEVHHAALVAALAARYGARVPAVAVAPRGVPSLARLAEDNAVEGGVHETWGVVLAHHQAAAARDPEVARALAVIARDEAEHAALAAAIDRWASSRLGAPARRRIRDARAAAITALPEAAAAAMVAAGADGRAALGLPDPASAAAIARRLGARLQA